MRFHPFQSPKHIHESLKFTTSSFWKEHVIWPRDELEPLSWSRSLWLDLEQRKSKTKLMEWTLRWERWKMKGFGAKCATMMKNLRFPKCILFIQSLKEIKTFKNIAQNSLSTEKGKKPIPDIQSKTKRFSFIKTSAKLPLFMLYLWSQDSAKVLIKTGTELCPD